MFTRFSKIFDFPHKPFSDSQSHHALSLESYIRCYGNNAHQCSKMIVADIEPHHCRFASSLHRGAPACEPDVSAFLYAALRLPDCINRVSHVLIGPTEEEFAAAGFPHVNTWTRVSSHARRRRQHYDGDRTLVVFVTSITDLDDMVPALCAFQIEWNKLHGLLNRSFLAKDLANGTIKASRVGGDIRHCLGLTRNDWELLVHVWGDDWDSKFAELAREPLNLTIERLPLHTRYFDDAAGRWWEKVIRHLCRNSSAERPVYLVSSNTHSLANLVSGYATAHQIELLDFLRKQNPERLWQTWSDSRKDPDQNLNNLLYYTLRRYLEHNPCVLADKNRWEESSGLSRYAPVEYPNLEAQKIELNRLNPSRLDSRLKWSEALVDSRAMIINMDYPLGLAAGHLLSKACRQFPRLRGVFILGKSAAVIGRVGDIMIPGSIHDSHTGNRYHFQNSLSVRGLTPFLNQIAAFDDQKSITVRGTFLHGRDTVSHLIKDDFTGIEMEAGPYMDALYRHFTGQAPLRDMFLDMNLPADFSLGLLHYTSDTPYNVRPSLLCSRMGLTGLEAAYASSLAILQRIMDLEVKRLKRAGSNSMSSNGYDNTQRSFILSSYKDRLEMIETAEGKAPADLLITNANLVNTLSGEIRPASVAIRNGVVLGFEDYQAKKIIDARGAYLCPGFIEAHIHIESTLLAPDVFARAVASMGTTAVICDPHEIANVLGVEGIEYFVESSRNLPVSIYFMLSSCVPATHLENAGAKLGVEDMKGLLARYPDRFLGLGEMMNFPGVLHGDPEVLAKLEMAKELRMDGHAPGLLGKDLNAYILAGPKSDHECIKIEEAREKLEKGMHIMIRQGTSQHNLKEVLPLVNDHNWPSFSMVSDDRHPEDLARHGHLDDNLRRAVKLGCDPVRAVQMVTINPARYFGLKNRGAIAPGYQADMVLVEDLVNFQIREVFLKGRALKEHSFRSDIKPPGNSIHIGDLSSTSFQIPAEGNRLRAIEIIPGQIVTRNVLAEPRIQNGLAEADPDRDLTKLAVVERHGATGNIGLGFVRGLGFKRCALASTVAHDSHNLIIAGTNDEDMLAAALEVRRMGGGLTAVHNGKILASVPLPIAGLMSDKPLKGVVAAMENLDRACRSMDIRHPSPFMILSFLALPVIPELKLTDKGLVDVNRFELVGLWED